MGLLPLILVLAIIPFAVPVSDGETLQLTDYQSPDGVYSYTTWGAGTDIQPYGSTVYGMATDAEILYIQAALEGFPTRIIESLEGCGSERIVIPSTVDTVKAGAFDRCSALKTLYFLGDRPDMILPDGIEVVRLEGTSRWGNESVLPLNVYKNEGSSFDYYVIDGKAVVRSLVGGTDIVIPSQTPDNIPFVSIGDCAFRDSKIKSIKMGEGLEEIGVRAFYGCWELTDIEYPSTLRTFRDECFRDCLRLESADFPNVGFIGFETFRECKALPSAVIPDSVTVMHDGAFYLCRSAKTVTIGQGITSIPPRCFGYCDSIVSIELPEKVTGIGWSAFYSCISLESIGLENVCVIGDDAFYGCYYLDAVGDLDSITDIGKHAFSDCRSLETITLSDSLKSLGKEAFEGCRSLESIRFLGDMPEIGEFAIPSDTEVICLSSNSKSWDSYDGKLTVEQTGEDSASDLPLVIVAAAIIIVVALLTVKTRRP